MNVCNLSCYSSLFLFVVAGSSLRFPQNLAKPSDPQVFFFASRSIPSLTFGTATSDVTLTSSVIWSDGANPGHSARFRHRRPYKSRPS